MALRLPGKGNFKPKAPLRRPPLAPPQKISNSQPTKPARPSIVTGPVSASAPPKDPSAAAAATSTSGTESSTPLPSQTPAVATTPIEPPPRQPKVASPQVEAPPAVALVDDVPPTLLPSVLPATEPTPAADRSVRASSVASVISAASQGWPATPSQASPSPATTPRGARKSKPLLAAAAASRTPTQRGTLREREKLKKLERAERDKIAAETQLQSRFTPTPRASPAPSTQGGYFPPTVSTSQKVQSPTATTHTSAIGHASTSSANADGTPSAASASSPVAVFSDLPPTVAPAADTSEHTSPASDLTNGTPDPKVLSAALTATIRPHKESVLRKRGASATASTQSKRRRVFRLDTVDTEDAGAESGVSDEEAENDDPDASGKPKRKLRGNYSSGGRAGTSEDRRTNAFKRRSVIAQPELSGVEANDMVGDEVNPTVMRMGDLATTLAAQGRVSARTIKLANFQREEDERKLRERATKNERNWRRRQIIRRKARELRNTQRAERREEARTRGDDPDIAVSADEIDSEDDYEPEPDRLTPPGSPQQKERIAPVRFEPFIEAHDSEEGTGKPSGNPAETEDIEGLGFHLQSEAPEEEFGEELEGFQLPVEEDAPGEGEAAAANQDFSGLQYNEYPGGYLDGNNNWIESGASSQAVKLQQRNEERRRRLIEGDHGQAVEVIDNDTQFVNSATWGKKVSNDRWTAEETELFFEVLRETGENYTLMKAYFPGRSVRQLKNKGSRENRMNPQRMTDAILNRRPMDKQYLAKSAGFNIDRPYDRENAFLDEVAREKERIVAGLDLIPDVNAEDADIMGMEVQNAEFAGVGTIDARAHALEFGVGV